MDDQHLQFLFEDTPGYVKLTPNAAQDKPFTGWDVNPHIAPLQVINNHDTSLNDHTIVTSRYY